MRPILIDTNAYTAFKKGDDTIIEIMQAAETLAISPIVLGELLSGFETGSKTRKNREELHQFLQSSRIKMLTITLDTAHFYSQIYAFLKKRGRPIPTNDLWIAAQSLEHGCVICTFDAHFKEIDTLVSGTTLAELVI